MPCPSPYSAMPERKYQPMLLSSSEMFEDKEYLYELKFDGIRAICYINPEKTVIINRNGKNVSQIFPELTTIHKKINKRHLPAVIDCEITLFNKSRPDFLLLQKRIMLDNKAKIDVAKKQLPVTLVAFDILVHQGKEILSQNLIDRKEILATLFKDSNTFIKSRFVIKEGASLFQFASTHQLEGIVAKRMDSKYQPGKRTAYWKKIKLLKEDDLLICGYSNDYPVPSLILGHYDNNKLVHATNVITNWKLIRSLPLEQTATKHFPINNVTFVIPDVIARITFLHRTTNGRYRHPVFKAIINDLSA